jgi:hypothetical protein
MNKKVQELPKRKKLDIRKMKKRMIKTTSVTWKVYNLKKMQKKMQKVLQYHQN